VPRFVWSKFLEAIERKAVREGVPFIKVPPPFTSTIGILKYQQQYGLSTHQSASYVIARRGLGFDNEEVPKPLIRSFIKARKGFKDLTNWKQWSSISQAVLAAMKKIKKGGASPVNWQHHRKQLSGMV
jgi:hypothetical protein